MGIFRGVELLYPPRSIRLSNNKVIVGIENKKLIKKLRIRQSWRQIKKLPIQVSYNKPCILLSIERCSFLRAPASCCSWNTWDKDAAIFFCTNLEDLNRNNRYTHMPKCPWSHDDSVGSFQSSPRRISRTTNMKRPRCLIYQRDTKQTSTAFSKHCESKHLITKCEMPEYKIKVLSQAICPNLPPIAPI